MDNFQTFCRWKRFDIGIQIAVLMILRMHAFEQPLFASVFLERVSNQGVFVGSCQIGLIDKSMICFLGHDLRLD